MAITLTVAASETYVKSGQPVNFLLTVANTDGASREVAVVSPVPVTPGISANFGVNTFDGTVADSSSLVIPFSGVFFAPAAATEDEDAQSQTVQFKVNVQVEDSDGAITSQNVSSVISMSVVPNIPVSNQPLPNVFPSLNFQSNNNAIHMVLPLV